MRDLKNTGDDDLVLLLKSGDHEAFEQIYHRYKGLLISHAYKKLCNFEDYKKSLDNCSNKEWLLFRPS
ncbi:RNA polymerase sigma factor [Pedobacter sp. PWIIR3]